MFLESGDVEPGLSQSVQSKKCDVHTVGTVIPSVDTAASSMEETEVPTGGMTSGPTEQPTTEPDNTSIADSVTLQEHEQSDKSENTKRTKRERKGLNKRPAKVVKSSKKGASKVKGSTSIPTSDGVKETPSKLAVSTAAAVSTVTAVSTADSDISAVGNPEEESWDTKYFQGNVCLEDDLMQEVRYSVSFNLFLCHLNPTLVYFVGGTRVIGLETT